MIYEVLQIVTDEVNNYLESLELTASVELNNIALVDNTSEDPSATMEDKVILSLVNMQEEKTLKNFPKKHVQENGSFNYQNGIVNLNLYLLFSSNKSSYTISLRYISKVIEFFQGKRLFTHTNSSYDRDNASMANLKDFRFTVEFYTPSFEELNFIWGTLGGKQYPSALYKLSLIEIERDVTAKGSNAISGIGVNNALKNE